MIIEVEIKDSVKGRNAFYAVFLYLRSTDNMEFRN